MSNRFVANYDGFTSINHDRPRKSMLGGFRYRDCNMPNQGRRHPATTSNHPRPRGPQGQQGPRQPPQLARTNPGCEYQKHVSEVLQHFQVIARVITCNHNGNDTAHERALLQKLVKFVPANIRQSQPALKELDGFHKEVVNSLRQTGVNLRTRALGHEFADAVTARLPLSIADRGEFTARAFNHASRHNSCMQGIRKSRDLQWSASPHSVIEAVSASIHAMTSTDLRENITAGWKCFRENLVALSQTEEQADRSFLSNPNPSDSQVYEAPRASTCSTVWLSASTESSANTR